jgi:hypothetical protein
MPFETDKSGGFKIDASDLLKTGVYPERFDKQIPFWETVNGVQYTEFGMRRKAGRELLHDFKAAPQYSATPIRGITATREYDTNVAYVGDLKNIYSYVLEDPLATPANSPSVKTVGSGYNLLSSSAGTIWDAGEGLEITEAYIQFGTLVIKTIADHGLTSGSEFSVQGLTGFTGFDPNGPYTAVYPTGDESLNQERTITVPVPGESNDAYTVTGATVGLGETHWDGSTTTWDGSSNTPDQWDFETFGSFVVGAKGSTQPVIKKNNVTFNGFHSDRVSGATVTLSDAEGTNYAVGDTLTTTSPNGSGITATVTKVNAGKLVDFEITNWGNSDYVSGDTITFVTVTSPTGGSGATATVTVPNIDFDTLECFHKQGPHMLAFNYTKGAVDYSTSFAWCSADNLDDWVGTATNTAGSLLIREAETPIRCVCQLGNGLAVYTESQMFVVNYVGLPNIFGYQVALEGNIGAVSPNSVVSVGRQNYGVTRDGFFVTDGAAINMIGNDSGISQFFRDNVSESVIELIYGFENSKENEVVWAVPFGSSVISKEFYYNYKTGQWGMRDQVISAYLDRGVFQHALSGDSIGNFYYEGNTPGLANPSVSAVTKAHDLNDADRVKEISAIRVGKEGSGSPVLSVGWADTIDGEPNYTDGRGRTNSFIINNTFESFPIRSAGRYITMKVESNNSSDNWTLTNLEVQGRMEGER